jgi:hypothetical protein
MDEALLKVVVDLIESKTKSPAILLAGGGMFTRDTWDLVIERTR